jgi:hypothetical protein
MYDRLIFLSSRAPYVYMENANGYGLEEKHDHIYKTISKYMTQILLFLRKKGKRKQNSRFLPYITEQKK